MESDPVRSRFVCPVNFQVNAPRTPPPSVVDKSLKPVFVKTWRFLWSRSPSMHAGTSLPAWRHPSRPPFFDVPHLGLWQHNITVVHETTRHALTAARVALDHDKVRLKDSHGDYVHRQFLMVGLLQQQHPVTLATVLVGHAVATIASLTLCLYRMKKEFVMHTTALKHSQAPSVQPPLQSDSVVSQSADSSSLSDTR